MNYAYRNMDPFDGNGQFCDKGSSYYPAIYYETEDELMAAETVLAEILEMNPDWSEDDIKAPILERPTFWTGEFVGVAVAVWFGVLLLSGQRISIVLPSLFLFVQIF